MKIKSRTGLMVLTVGGMLAIVAAAYVIAAQLARSDIRANGQRHLQIMALDLDSVIEKYEMLPFVLVFQPDVFAALAQPGNQGAVSRLNDTLASIQRQVNVAAIRVMDRNGKTLAAHNREQSQDPNFDGGNAGLPPYFRDAMAGKTGRFYGIGDAADEPGYFITQPVYRNGTPYGPGIPIGVVTVKISLAEFERTWIGSEEPIALADRNGVVFLSNRSAWRYHSQAPLDQTVRENLAATGQYGGRNILPLTSKPELARADFGPQIVQPVNRLGWQLILFPSEARVARNGWVAAAGAALLLAIAGSSLWAMNQRRRRLDEQLVSRKALEKSEAELDKKIAQRTQSLLLANENLEAKFARLKDTELLLRSSQNELIQAGKLTMLGQMAAGATRDLTPPLAAIQAFADNAVTFLSRRQINKAKENLAEISAAAARMASVISQLKGFRRTSDYQLGKVDLSESVRKAALLLESEFLRNGVELEIKIVASPEVVGDALKIEQVVINLLRNALDASAGAPVKKVAVRLECPADDALLRVRDFGAGIPHHVAEHLFEPFFTTKPTGKGPGLGLAISSAIIQAMNGRLTAQNHVNGGAEFVLQLPLSATA